MSITVLIVVSSISEKKKVVRNFLRMYQSIFRIISLQKYHLILTQVLGIGLKAPFSCHFMHNHWLGILERIKFWYPFSDVNPLFVKFFGLQGWIKNPEIWGGIAA
jgi:hypothetical protein